MRLFRSTWPTVEVSELSSVAEAVTLTLSVTVPGFSVKSTRAVWPTSSLISVTSSTGKALGCGHGAYIVPQASWGSVYRPVSLDVVFALQAGVQVRHHHHCADHRGIRLILYNALNGRRLRGEAQGKYQTGPETHPANLHTADYIKGPGVWLLN